RANAKDLYLYRGFEDTATFLLAEGRRVLLATHENLIGKFGRNSFELIRVRLAVEMAFLAITNAIAENLLDGARKVSHIGLDFHNPTHLGFSCVERDDFPAREFHPPAEHLVIVAFVQERVP